MKYTFTGDQSEITLRGVTFPKGKAVDVEDEALRRKIDALPYFEQGIKRPRKKASSDD
jgi:hypothetical protein